MDKLQFHVYCFLSFGLLSLSNHDCTDNFFFNCAQHFYHVLMCTRKPQGRGLELARKHVASCLSELACMSKSLGFLRSNACGSHQAEIEDGTTASGSHPIGFDASLNSKLSAPTPPRSIKLLSWKKVSF